MKSSGEKKNLSNIEKLVAFTQEEEPELIPVFLSLLEVCFHGEEHSFQEFQIVIR